MKKLLLSLVSAGLCASAFALTVNDLDGKRVAVVFQGNDFQLSFPTAASGAYFTKVDNNTLLLNNWYDGLGRTMKLDAKGNLTLNLYDGYSGPFDWGYGMDIYGVSSICREVQATYTYDGETAILLCWQYGMLDEQVPSTQHVSQDGDLEGWGFNHRGNAGQGPAILFEWMGVKNNNFNDPLLVDINCFNGFTMYSFPCNAMASEYQGMFLSDMYPVDVQIDNDGNLTIKNFLNQGMSYQVNVNTLQYGINWVYGTVDKETGAIEIPIQEVAGTADFGFIGDLSDYDSFLGDGLFFSDGPEGYWFVYTGTSFYPWQIIDNDSFDKKNGEAASISGVMYSGVGTHSGSNRWVSNDGDCTTNVNTVLDLGPIGLYASEFGDVIASADRTTIEFGNESTTDVKLKISKAVYSNTHVMVNGSLGNAVNTETVDHFDIYAVPGEFSSIYDGGFDIDDITGHKDAVLVYDGSQEDELEYMFMSDPAQLNSAITGNGNKNFTFFVKTNYKPESGLEPTFHAMAIKEATYNASTDAIEIEETAKAKVTAADGVITISGTDAEATVYNAAGAVVYQGLDREIPATSGVYVVRLGNTAKKVVL